MPTELGSINVNYTGTEANEIFLAPVFTGADILDNFRVLPNVVSRKKMAFVESLEKIVRRYTGCGFTPVGSFNAYERTIEVEPVKIDMELCWDEFADTIFEELLKRGSMITDLTGTDIEEILITRIQQAIRLDIQRLFWFGDTGSVDADYDSTDGLLTVHVPALVAANLIPHYDIADGAIAAGDGITILRTVWDNAPNELKGLPADMKCFYVTGSVYQAYLEDVEDTTGGDYGISRTVEGVENLTFRGVPVKAGWRWDDIYANDLSASGRNVALLTTPTNLAIATDILRPGSDLMIWHEKKDDKLYVKGKFKLGTNYVHPSLMSVAY